MEQEVTDRYPRPLIRPCLYVAHQVCLFVAEDLEWDPLEGDAYEEIRVQTYTLQEALEEIRHDYRVDPEAALALLLYAQQHDH